MVVSTTGEMALMNTMHPLVFVDVKLALAKYLNRDPLMRSKDVLQAELVTMLVRDYMPQYARLGPEGADLPASNSRCPLDPSLGSGSAWPVSSGELDRRWGRCSLAPWIP